MSFRKMNESHTQTSSYKTELKEEAQERSKDGKCGSRKEPWLEAQLCHQMAVKG